MTAQCNVKRFGDDFILVAGDGPIRTPMGTPLVSRYESLLREAADNVAALGVEPTEQFSMFSLQASYLDFTFRRPRAQLEAGLERDAGADIWFNRPAFPPMNMALGELWGAASHDALEAFPARLRKLSLRQLTSVIVARANLNSAQLALEALGSDDLLPLAKGACASHFEALLARRSSGPAMDVRDESAWRRPPVNGDSAACEACLAGNPAGPVDAGCCEFHGHLLLLRRFAEFPEEPLQRSIELLDYLGRDRREGRGRPSSGHSQGLRRPCECETHVDRAMDRAKAGDLEGAIEEYGAATHLCCDNAQAWLYLGNCHFNLGNHSEALHALERAMTIAPDVALIWESKANILNDLDRDEEAFDCYVRALELDPTRVRSRVELARVMIDQRRFADALDLADGALGAEPGYWYALALRARALQELGRLDEAELSYRESIVANPSSAQTINNYGALIEARGNRDGALALYERAVQANPRYDLAVRNRRRLTGG